jgi:hypothetical protein
MMGTSLDRTREGFMDSMTVEWSDTLAASRRGSRVHPWTEIAQACRENEGKWGLFFTDSPLSVVNSIYSGKIKELKIEDGFRVRTRNNRLDPNATPRRRCDVWIAYKPKDED